MSDDEPAIDIAPTAVSVRVVSAPAKVPDFKFAARRTHGHEHTSRVIMVTAVDMTTANAMIRISDNDVVRAKIQAGEKTRTPVMLAIILGGVLLLIPVVAGPHTIACVIAFGSLCALLGGTTITKEIMDKRKPDELPAAVPPDASKSEPLS